MDKYEEYIGLTIAVINLITAIVTFKTVKESKKNPKKSSSKKKRK